MKSFSIQESIAVLLREHSLVMIPGLGGFVGSYAPAQVDQVLGNIQPPGLRIHFDENLAANDGLLAAYISKAKGITAEAAAEEISAFVQQARTTLTRSELLTFPEVGRLRLDFEGKIQFLPEGSNLNPETFGLPGIRFYPLRPQEKPAEQKQEPLTAPLPPSGSGNPVNAGFVLIGAILIVTLAAYFIFRPQINALFFSPVPEKNLPEARVNVPPAPAVVPPAEADSMEEEDVFVEEDMDAPVPESSRQQCIIIVGRFKDQNNVKRLVERISKSGFEPFTEESGGLTRVGVQFYYQEDAEVQATLRNVQDKLDPNAFVWRK